MTRAEATRGPWRHTGKDGFVIAADGTRVAQTFDKFEDDFDNWESNGPLIAAAPDLLTALEQIDLAPLSHGDDAIEEIQRIAREAISKAKGAP